MTWRDRFACWMHGHVPKSEISYQDAVLHEPFVGQKTVRMRVMMCKCARCGTTLDVQPLGLTSLGT